jgi:hypothetical protein
MKKNKTLFEVVKVMSLALFIPLGLYFIALGIKLEYNNALLFIGAGSGISAIIKLAGASGIKRFVGLSVLAAVAGAALTALDETLITNAFAWVAYFVSLLGAMYAIHSITQIEKEKISLIIASFVWYFAIGGFGIYYIFSLIKEPNQWFLYLGIAIEIFVFISYYLIKKIHKDQ